MADNKVTENKKSSINPIVGIGIGCLVILVVLGIISTLVMRFFAKKIGTSIIQTAIENKTGIKADLNDIQNGKLTFTDKESGQTVNIGSNTLPSDFPKDFPQYPGATIDGSVAGSNFDNMGVYVSFRTKDSADKVNKFFADKLKANGWKVTSTYTAEEMTTYSVEKDTQEGSLIITNDKEENQTLIAVTVGKKSDTTEE